MFTITRFMRFAAVSLAAVLAACATHKVTFHEVEPGRAGKPMASVMVVAVTYDKVLRRVYEDRMVTRLGERGVKGVASYNVLEDSRVEETALRDAVARSGVEGVLITREGAVDRTTTRVSGGTVAAQTSSVGMYGWYAGTWSATEFAPTDLRGAAWTRSVSRLFDARDGAPVWTGSVETSLERGKGMQIDRYVDLVFETMVADKVI